MVRSTMGATVTKYYTEPYEPSSPRLYTSKDRRKEEKLTVSLSAKISLMLKMLREMCATGSPPKVTLAERSYQVPRTSSSMFLPSDSFLKVTVDSLARTVVVLERELGRETVCVCVCVW